MRFGFPVFFRRINDDLTVWGGVDPVDKKQVAAGIEWSFW